jgi:RNA polymerase sigma-70 factor (ECF subfamily)
MATDELRNAGTPMPERTARLVEEARGGDADAFDALIGPRLPRLLRLAASILGSEADAADVVQDACLDAWRRLPSLRDADRLDSWLAQMVVNDARDALRRRRRVQVREVDADVIEVDREMGTRRPLADAVTGAIAIRRAFGRLQPGDRAILALHHVDQRPVTEIAGVLGIPEGTAKWRLHRARKALERALERER